MVFKDMSAIKGYKLHNGGSPRSPERFIEIPSYDDVLVAKFRRVGAVILGLTIMTEGGVSPLGYNSHFQGPVSPFSMNRYSGGSSGGSAVAVATGIAPLGVGFDGGGSIRIPASMSGIHGLATTFGRYDASLCWCAE